MWQDINIPIKQWNTNGLNYLGTECIGSGGVGINGMTKDDVCAVQKTQGDTAYNYCKNLNLSGYSDWRLPHISELGDLSRYQQPKWIDDNTIVDNTMPHVFLYPKEKMTGYWSDNQALGVYNQNSAWMYGSRTGSLTYVPQTIPLNVRCVRNYSESDISIDDINTTADDEIKRNFFIIANDKYDITQRETQNIVVDNLRKIEWEISNSKGYRGTNWKEAVEYCHDKNTSGGGWRLPTINELLTIGDYRRDNLSLKSSMIQEATSSGRYYSSTTVRSTPGNLNQAHTYETYKGTSPRTTKNTPIATICVRNMEDR